MKLVDEVVDVWRPVTAIRIRPSVYAILPDGLDPNIEEWEFLPGEHVEVAIQERNGSRSLIAVARAAVR